MRFRSGGVGCLAQPAMTAHRRPVTEIHIGGTAYRVQSSADEAELARLVEIVETRLAALSGQRRNDSRSLVLVALSLAHELEQLRNEHATLRAEISERLTRLVGRIDSALDYRDENGEPLPPIPALSTSIDDQLDGANGSGANGSGASETPADGDAHTDDAPHPSGTSTVPGAATPIAATHAPTPSKPTPTHRPIVSAPDVTPPPPDVAVALPRPHVAPEPAFAPRRTPAPRPRRSTTEST